MPTLEAGPGRAPGIVRQSAGTVVPAALLVLALALVGAEVAHRAGVPVTQLTRDPASEAGVHPNTGALSILGCMGWAVAAALLLHAARVRHAAGDRGEFTRGYVAFATVAVVWGLDDALMIHDFWLWRIGVPEELTFAAMCLGALVVAAVYRRVVQRTELALLALAAAGFALSIVLDLPHALAELEDVPKLWGIGLVVIWAWRASGDLVMAVQRRGPAVGGRPAPGPRVPAVVPASVPAGTPPVDDAPVDLRDPEHDAVPVDLCDDDAAPVDLRADDAVPVDLRDVGIPAPRPHGA